MATRTRRLTSDVVDEVAEIVRSRLSGHAAESAEAFIRRFYRDVPPDDVIGVEPENLYGAALALWRFGENRRPGTPKIRVYNPSISDDGWTSSHTVVEIVNDDMPFLVDSVTAELNRQQLAVHLVIHPIIDGERDAGGRLAGGDQAERIRESFMHVQVDEQTAPDRLAAIRSGLERVLGDVRAAVEDWAKMRARLADLVQTLETSPPPAAVEEVREACEFLRWVDDNNYTFLGYRSYDFEGEGDDLRAVMVPESGLGILREDRLDAPGAPAGLAVLPAESLRSLVTPRLLDVNKASARATVHRPSHMDYVGIKRFDQDGKVVGVWRFLGLFTSVVYNTSPRRIPVLRRKVSETAARAGFAPNSHDEKALIHILETYPRDELFQIDADQLFETAMGILHLQERQRIALFLREDPFQRFVSCLVYVPRDHYNTRIRKRFGDILASALGGEVTAFYTQVGDEPLARIQYMVRTTPANLPEYDAGEIERRLVEAGRSWDDRLQHALIAANGEAAGLDLFRRYAGSFPVAYREAFNPDVAVQDVRLIEAALEQDELGMHLFRPPEAAPHELRLKIYRVGEPVPLSDVLPMLENMGLRVVGEVPYALAPDELGRRVWIHDFAMTTPDRRPVDLRSARAKFQEAFGRLWRGEIENDGLNRLVLGAGLDWRQTVVLRAFSRYLRQIGTPFSQAYMEETLAQHATLACRIVELFESRFDPARQRTEERASTLRGEIFSLLDEVQSLDQDRILRRFLNLAEAAVRTSHYQPGPDGAPKPYLAIKFDSGRIEELPPPRPMAEIFVYSPRVEAIHLRGGKVARGGIRWSDRREDFRTEVLGLMKAQMVKNAVIVPVGAKGGFVVKRPPADPSREAQQAEGIECYKTLIRGMLDLTDNLDGARVVPPEHVVRYDGDDPYIVAAADKGTATFSDIANDLSADYGYWLDDAFASGGSAGYDHKGMGITARGAWESVKRHFRELGRDIQNEDFTCVAVGDMSGDVFGNGMLLSRHTRLLAAFNHMHIFVDPDPDAATSFEERKRLFDLPRSSWSDYDRSLLSKGGAVFDRHAKSLRLSPEIRTLLRIDREEVPPATLMHAILCAEVDLLFFGGIGTYVKSAHESHAEVGDKANDAIRADGAGLRAKVVGEGANLGVTQRGRVEYALAGGRINTDFIDNSGGVDSSDHEVNIKILLGRVVSDGELTLKQRNDLLKGMTDDVAALVLRHNYLQSMTISVEEADAPALIGQHGRLIRALERSGRLDRALEALPDDEGLAEREAAKRGLTRPEIAVLLCYGKLDLFDKLLPTDFPDDPQLADDLLHYFPPLLRERFPSQVQHHRLRREILTTAVANKIVDRGGITFVSELQDKTGRSESDIARAFSISVAVFGLEPIWIAIEMLDNVVAAEVQIEMLRECARIVERGTLWFLRHAASLDVAANLEEFRPGITRFCEHLSTDLFDNPESSVQERKAALVAKGVEERLARSVTVLDPLASAPDIVRTSEATGTAVEDVARTYFAVGERFHLEWLRQAAEAIPTTSSWQRLAIETFIDDLFGHQNLLTRQVLQANGRAGQGPAAAVEEWSARQPGGVARLDRLVDEARASGGMELAMLTVLNGHYRTMAMQ